MSNKIKIVSNEENVCPYCNSTDIDYEPLEIVEEMAYYGCRCNKCNRNFEQWYNLKFSGHNVGEYGHTEAEVGKEIDYDAC